MAEKRYRDGVLVEIAFTPSEVRASREWCLARTRVLRQLRKMIASEDFDGDEALALINGYLPDGP